MVREGVLWGQLWTQHRLLQAREADDGQVPVGPERSGAVTRGGGRQTRGSSWGPPPTHASLMGTKIKSFWNRSTCRVHVFTRLCFRLGILGGRKQRAEAGGGAGGGGGTYGRLAASAALLRSLWFSLL